MKLNYERLLENKPLIFIDKFLRFFGYCIVLKCDIGTKFCNGFFINKV